MKVKVFYHIWQTSRYNIEETIVFLSKELGWLEYFETKDCSDCLHFKGRKDAIISTYTQKHFYKKYGKLVFLGEL